MQWADYSGGRPSGAALRGAGFGGAIRYVGLGGGASLPGKRITAAEYRDLTGAGVQVLLVCEGDTTDAWGGYAAGVANARIALADARALGIPDAVGIAAAADAHAANQAQITAAVEYARGFQDVLGKTRTGFYGFQETVTAVRTAGVGSWYWRCGSQPSATEKAWTHLWQRNQAPTVRVVSGVTCDINEQYLPITSEEDDLTPDQSLKLDHIYNQLAGSFVAGEFPGWPSMVDKTVKATPVDFIRLIDLHTCQTNDKLTALATLVGQQNGVTAQQIADALKTGLEADLLPIVQQAVTAALGSDNAAQAEQIAAQVISDLGQKLAPQTPVA
jgi:hypothetical protein